MAVDAVRSGQAGRWLWIILVFGPLGAAVYFFSEYTGAGSLTRFSHRPRKVTAADVRKAEVEVKRLDNAPSWCEYASVLRARKEYGKAAEAARRALERNPNLVDARYQLGLSLLGAQRPAEAVEALQAVVAGDRAHDSGDALLALARAQQAAGNLPGARASLEELVEHRARPEILYELAAVQGLEGDRAAAMRALQRIIDEAELVPDYLQRDVRPWVKKARKGLDRLSR
jgi:hypothetical protein